MSSDHTSCSASDRSIKTAQRKHGLESRAAHGFFGSPMQLINESMIAE